MVVRGGAGEVVIRGGDAGELVLARWYWLVGVGEVVLAGWCWRGGAGVVVVRGDAEGVVVTEWC